MTRQANHEELVQDAGLLDDSKWTINDSVGSSSISGGTLSAIGWQGDMTPDLTRAVVAGMLYNYRFNITGASGGNDADITLGGVTLWELADGAGIVQGSVVATNTDGFVLQEGTTNLNLALQDLSVVAHGHGRNLTA